MITSWYFVFGKGLYKIGIKMYTQPTAKKQPTTKRQPTAKQNSSFDFSICVHIQCTLYTVHL